MAARRSDDASASTSSSSAHDLHDRFPEPPRWKYDVFLSFQGEGPNGTRNNFTDVLYNALCRKGVVTFKDDKELEKGRFIGDDLMMAIEDSALFLVVFSEDYASSKWCLDELTKIMDCSRNRGKLSSSSSFDAFVLPVFHDVEPKDVRKQKGSFEESFLRHEQDDAIDNEKVRKWKSAMTDAGNLSGWITHGRKWTEIADEIAELIFNRTNHHWSSFSMDLVGLDSRVQDIMTHLGKASTCFVGICGMGGIGKTTLADAVHRRIHHCFEASIFLQNIRETSSKDGLLSLQKQLISKLLMKENIHFDKESDGVKLIQKRLARKKVLIILDDVDHRKQLEALAASFDWFGMGSKVIITTRDEGLLNMHGAIVYNLKELNKNDALKLFCRKAFHSDSPPEGYVELSNHFINHAKGLPLALEVLGSSLTKRTIPEWQSAMSRLAEIPEETVTRTLRISFDGLEETAKKVFLLVACFFKGMSKSRALHILSCYFGFGLDDVISLLIGRSLVKQLWVNLWMHDLIQEMGWEVVRHESPDDPGKRSLLWHSKDIYRVLRFNMATDFIRGIVLKSTMTTFRPLSAKAFSQMTKLRLLILPNISFCDSLTYLSNELRYVKWKGFPFEFLPTSFEAEDLVELNLPNSQLKELWHGTKYFMHLKTIKLSHSKSLLKTPNLTGAPHLEKIILEGCSRLQEIDKSIGVLDKLSLLNLKGCEQLKVLPDSICDLKSLRFFDLSGCSSLVALPQNFGSLKCLEELKVAGTAMKQSWISWLSCFSFLLIGSSGNSRGLYVPPLSGLTSLKQLDLSFCNLSDGAIPNDIGLLHSLEKLKLDGNIFTELSPCFTQLTKLTAIYLNHCKSLRCLPTLPSSVEYVGANDCPSLESLPNHLTVRAVHLSCLYFRNCKNLVRSCGSSELANMLLENYVGSLRHQATNEPTGFFGLNLFFEICIPGNSIPTWISNQSQGNFVSIDFPDQGKWTALVVCCVFSIYEHQDASNDNLGNEADNVAEDDLMISFYVGTDEGLLGRLGLLFLDRRSLPSESDHIWLLHASSKNFSYELQSCFKRIDVSFEGHGCVNIKSCGAHLVFEQQATPTQACQITQLD